MNSSTSQVLVLDFMQRLTKPTISPGTPHCYQTCCGKRKTDLLIRYSPQVITEPTYAICKLIPRDTVKVNGALGFFLIWHQKGLDNTLCPLSSNNQSGLGSKRDIDI